MDGLLQVISDGIFWCNFEGEILFYNPAFLKIVQIGNEQIPNQLFSIFSEKESAKLRKDLQSLEKNNIPQKGLIKIVDRINSSEKYIDYFFVSSVYNGHKAVAGKFSDITESVLHEQNMRTIIAREKEINSLKSIFIRVTSHELRTPLAVILSNSEMLQMYLNHEIPPDAEIEPAELLDGTIRKVNLMTEILDQLMMYSKIENGKVDFKPERTNITHLIGVVANDFYSPYLDGRKLQVKISLESKFYLVDKILLRHAIINLLNNAFKYSAGKQAPEFNIEEDESHLYFEITDFGIGVPEEERNLIFNNFYRASNTKHVSGAGIGLMIVDFVVKKHNGTIVVKSNLGKGSVFTLIIPKNVNS